MISKFMRIQNSKFNGAVVFTIVDLDKGYWQVLLHPDLRKYTCMALDIGHFQWKWLPMGTIIASDIFQGKLDAIFADNLELPE